MSRGKLAVAIAWTCVSAISAGAEEPQAPVRPRQVRMEQMRENQRKLDELVEKMNAATGQAKVDAIAAVVTELVAQRRAMGTMMGGPMGGPMKRPQEQPAP
jgi:hypothetical protein